MIDYIEVFDRNHTRIDILYEFSNLTYTNTLNGKGKASFTLTLTNSKCTKENLEFFNHIEFRGDWANALWGGFIAEKSFGDGIVVVNCIGYLGLLDYRLCVKKNYNTMTYGNLIYNMMVDANNVYAMEIGRGEFQNGSLLTQRNITNEKTLYQQITELCIENSYDVWVEVAFMDLNFAIKKGSDKSYYKAIYSQEFSNIEASPSLTQNVLDFTNYVYCTNNNENTLMFSEKYDTESMNKYGRRSSYITCNSEITMQTDIDNIATSEVNKKSSYIQDIGFTLLESDLCPFYYFDVGDTINVSIPDFFDYNENVRILELTYNQDSNKMNIATGQTLYRPSKPQSRIYSRR